MQRPRADGAGPMTVNAKFVRYRWRCAVRLFCEGDSLRCVAFYLGVTQDTAEECLRKQLRLQAKGEAVR